jgi:hypothetical protein
MKMIFLAVQCLEYNKDLAELSKSASQPQSHSRGVKQLCILNSIPDFHVTTDYSLDIMHIVLEGIVSVELSCILHALCNVETVFADARYKKSSGKLLGCNKC